RGVDVSTGDQQVRPPRLAQGRGVTVRVPEPDVQVWSAHPSAFSWSIRVSCDGVGLNAVANSPARGPHWENCIPSHCFVFGSRCRIAYVDCRTFVPASGGRLHRNTLPDSAPAVRIMRTNSSRA